jgi:hypothetical protein
MELSGQPHESAVLHRGRNPLVSIETGSGGDPRAVLNVLETLVIWILHLRVYSFRWVTLNFNMRDQVHVAESLLGPFTVT